VKIKNITAVLLSGKKCKRILLPFILLIALLAMVIPMGTPAEAATVIDQSQTASDIGPYNPNLYFDKYAQIFTPGVSGKLESVNIYVGLLASQNYPVTLSGGTIEIYNVSSGKPSGTTPLASATIANHFFSNRSVTSLSYVFTTKPDLIAETPYALVVDTGNGTGWGWYGSGGNGSANPNPYSGGNALGLVHNTTTWQAVGLRDSWLTPDPDIDFAFQTSMTPAPSLSVSDVPVVEGNGSGVVFLNFTISLSSSLATDVTFNYATADHTAYCYATGGDDYFSDSGTGTITHGQTSCSIQVAVDSDTVLEPDETLYLNISNVTAGVVVLDSQGVGTIQNDDSSLTIADTSHNEGNSGNNNFSFTATLNQACSLPVSVDYYIPATDPQATAQQGSDYYNSVGTLTIPKNNTTGTINVQVIGDTDVETDETFVLCLNNPVNAQIPDGRAIGTILNDDSAPVTYTLTYNANGGSGTAPAPVSLAAGAPFTAAATNTFTAPTGKQFKQWNTATDGTGTSYTAGTAYSMPANNLTLNAIWENIPVNSYNLTINKSGNGTVPPGGSTAQGTWLVLTATPDTGWSFSTWGGDYNVTFPWPTTQNPIMFNMPARNVNLLATFTHNQYGVYGTVFPAGSGTINPNNSIKYYGDSVSITATPAAGYRFVSWSGDYTGPDSTLSFTMPARDVRVTAQFALDDTTAPTFNTQYYSDSDLTISKGDNPRLNAGTYYIKITANEALSVAPTISIDAEGTANDVTDGTTVLVSGNEYKYTRTIMADPAAIGVVLENISITGTDISSNTATDANPTNEATKAAYTVAGGTTLISPANGAIITYSNSFNLEWTKAVGTFRSFSKVQVDNDSDFSSPVVSTDIGIDALEHYVTLANGTYYWRALNGIGSPTPVWGPWSAVSTFTVDVRAGIGASSTVSASPTSVVADGSSTSIITVTIMDDSNNPVSNRTVTLNQGGGHSTISPASSASDSNGVVTFTVKDTTAETVAYTAIETTDSIIITQTASVTFTGTLDAAQSTLTPTASGITANGTATQVLTVQAKDSSGTDMTTGGATITITKSSGTGSIGSVTDNGNGTYTATVTAPTTAGSGIFVATLNDQPVKSGGGSQTQATVSYVAGPLTTITVSPSSQMLDMGGTQTFTATGTDSHGNAVSITPSWSCNTTTGSIDSGTGAFTAGTTAGTYTNAITATSGSIHGYASVTVNPAGTVIYENVSTGYFTMNGIEIRSNPSTMHAQTFLTTSSHDINAVSLMLSPDNYTGYVHVSIQSAGYTGSGYIPLDTDLVTGILYINNSTDNNNTWYNVPLSSAYTLGNNTRYAIVVYANNDYGTHTHGTDTYQNEIYWGYASPSSYSNGNQCNYSSSSGWSVWPGSNDYLFKLLSYSISDTTPPSISSGTLAANNGYLDITFSEGIYGASDGTTALMANNLALTFTQNGGNATNVVVSSVKKNDSSTEGSASSLTGGETTVRVFLTITGTPSGVETIELKPANGTSIYDTAGNSMSASQTAGVKTLNDDLGPTVTINQAVGQADPTTTSPVNFAVGFSEAVTDFATGDVTLGGTAGATIATVTGSGTTYNVAVSGMTTSGTVIITIPAGAATDAAGNSCTDSTNTDNSVTYQTGVAPSVSDQPNSVIITYGANTSFTSTGGGTPTPTVHWEVNTGSGFSDVSNGGVYSGATTTTLTLTRPPVAYTAYQYHAVFDNEIGSDATSNAASLTINPKSLTITGISIANKVYDTTNTATISGTPTLSGIESGDTVTLGGSPTATFADKNVGTGKTVTVAGYTISGADSSNYTLTQPAGLTANITQFGITGSFTADNKVYDGTTSATVLTRSLSGVLSDDTVSLTGGTATFDNKNVGTDKTVTLTAATLTGADAGNYSLNNVTPTTTANITVKSLTVNATGVDKVYDGTNTATVDLSSDKLSNDTVTPAYTSAAFTDKNVGADKTINVTGISISGTDAGNYNLASTTSTTTANITAKDLTVTAVGVDKIYDGNTTATVNLSSNKLAGDTVSLAYTSAAFIDKGVGNSKTINVSGISISGTDAGNYHLTDTTATATADITALEITGSFIADNKVYDGTTTATVLTRSLNGVLLGDTVSLTGGTATFDNQNIGTGKTVTLTNATLSGTDAVNYTLTSVGTITANITAKSLTVNATGVDKVYDGTNTATVDLSSDKLSNDTVTPAYTSAAFTDKNVGTGKTVNVSGVSISGADAGNYTLTNTTATATADIAAKTLAVSATGINKVYDGDTAATVNLSDNRIAGDVLTISYVSATFANENVGTGKTVTVTGISVTDIDAGNYTFNTSTTTTADITALGITGSFTADNKVYDGTTSATVLTRSLSGVLGNDAVTLTNGTATFSDKNAGTGKTVTLTGATLSGTDAGNYNLTSVDTTTASITSRPITVTAVFDSKVYDGTTGSDETPAISPGSLAPGDTANFTQAFDNKNVGSNKTLTPSGTVTIGSSGMSIAVFAQVGNYDITFVSVNTGEITARPITVIAATDSKTYDGTISSDGEPTITSTLMLVTGDSATWTQAFDTKDVGTGKTLTPAGTVNDGNSGNNYTVDFATNNTGVITKATLTVTAEDKTSQYSDPRLTLTASITGFVGDETLATSGVTGSPSYTTDPSLSDPITQLPGTYTITPAVGTLAADNYDFTFVNGTYTVTQEDPAMAFTLNPVAIRVHAPGGDNSSFTLEVTISKSGELYEHDWSLIEAADFTLTLTPVGGGSPITGIHPSGFDEDKGIATFTFAESYPLPVETYSMEVTLDNSYYVADPVSDVIVIYDPSLGFTTGGGWFIWPADGSALAGAKTNFGYTMKYNSKATNIQGGFLLIAHLADGSIYRIKSNALSGLSIDKNTCIATFSGKCTFMYPNPTSGLDPINVGGKQFFVWVKDIADPGAGADQIWLTTLTGIPGVSFSTDTNTNGQYADGEQRIIEQGNIFVPKTCSGDGSGDGVTAPTVTGVNPNQGNRGQTISNVEITGTGFTGVSKVSFGAGITVSNVKVDSNTKITATIAIASNAKTGTRNVSVTTSGGTATQNGGFTIN
jgi:hypothetical protein